MNHSLVLITNGENQSFGTGFVVWKERNHSYIVTCAHVVEQTQNSLLVDSVNAKIIYHGSSNGLDLAVLKAPIKREPLFLMQSECDNFEISGFKSFRNNDHILEPINSILDTKVEFRPQSGEVVSGWKLTIDERDVIVGGYSGSPLICKKTGKVVAVMSNRHGSREGFAISIENLKRVWPDMPRNLILKEGYLPKVFINRVASEADNQIASHFNEALKSRGLSTFLPQRSILIDNDRLQEIDEALASCDYFLLLLSKNSLSSEMVLEELQTIKKLQNGANFPAILPIRVNLPSDYNVNYDLLKQIDKIKPFVWETERDTSSVADQIVTLVGRYESLAETSEPFSLTDTDMPIPNAPLEQPTGVVPLDSRYYIARDDDERCYQNLSGKYSLIRIKAPRQYGKTSLLARLILKAKALDYHVISFNFQEFDRSLLSDLNELLAFICEMVAFELGREIDLNPILLKRLTPMLRSTYQMQKILSQLDKPLVLAIDEADKLFDYTEVSDEFFGLIRAWHEKSKSDPLWANLKLLLSHSTEPLLGISSINQSPFHNVGLGIELKPFSSEELRDLVVLHGLKFDASEIERFKSFVGGHPYLSRKVLYHMLNKGDSLDQIITNAQNDESIFMDHMRRYLWILKDNQKLMDLIHTILKGYACHDDASCYILEATGLIQNSINQPRFSCELYRAFFDKKL